jgi:hypothetical protein
VWVDGRQVVRDGKSARVNEAVLLDEIAALMPVVQKKIDQLRADGERLSAVFADLQRKAWTHPLDYNRYLQRN